MQIGEKCGKSCFGNEYARNHQVQAAQKHFQQNGSEKLYACKICKIIFHDSSSLNTHIWAHSDVSISQKNSQLNGHGSARGRLFAYESCEIGFSSEDVRARHSLNCNNKAQARNSRGDKKDDVIGEKVAMNGPCQWTSVNLLTVHQLMCKDKKPFACELCGEAFAEESQIIAHRLMRHIDDTESHQGKMIEPLKNNESCDDLTFLENLFLVKEITQGLHG